MKAMCAESALGMIKRVNREDEVKEEERESMQ